MVRQNDQLWRVHAKQRCLSLVKSRLSPAPEAGSCTAFRGYLWANSSHGCKPQTATGTCMCSCPVPAWWIPGALAWNVAWFFSPGHHDHIWTICCTSFPHWRFSWPLFCLPSVFLRPQLVCAMLCAWQPACPVDCLSVVRHGAYHMSLANPLRIFFFFFSQRFMYTGLFPKGWTDNMILWNANERKKWKQCK